MIGLVARRVVTALVVLALASVLVHLLVTALGDPVLGNLVGPVVVHLVVVEGDDEREGGRNDWHDPRAKARRSIDAPGAGAVLVLHPG